MRASLILQAVDRISGPARRAMNATRALAQRGVDTAARAAQRATNATRNLVRSGLDPIARAANRVRATTTRMFPGLPAQLGRIRAAARRAADGGMRVLERSALMAARGVGRAGRAALAFGRSGVLALGAGAGVLGGWLTSSVIGIGSKFEQFQVVLENTEGSAAKAKAAMAWVKNFAKTTPYEINDVMEAFVALKAYGIDGANGSLRSLGNAASGMGKPLMQAIEMLADAQTGEFERLKEFGVRASQTGDKVTFTYMRAGKEVTRTAKKSAGEIQRAVLGIFDARFAGMMDRQATTLSGMWSNLQDMLGNFQLDIAGGGFFDTIKSKVQTVLDEVNRLAEDGTLKRWADEISAHLSDMVEKAWQFAKDTDWKSVGDTLQGVGNAMWTIARATAAAVRMVERLNSILGGLPKPPGWINGADTAARNGVSKFLFTPFSEWGAGGQKARPAAPAMRRPMTDSQRRDTWRRAAEAPAGGPRKLSLDLNLRGPGAAQVQVGRLQADRDTTLNVQRGRAMGGAA